MSPWSDIDAFRGGCQCGACRFRAEAGRARQTVCHCRMCRRAVGNAFAPLLEVDEDRVTWEGAPKIFASSNIADRGFCGICGTPLFYRRPSTGTIEFMAGALDAPERYAPTNNHGIESRLAWVVGLSSLPDRETFLTEGEAIVSCQHGD